MFFGFGERLYGRIERCENTYKATRFFHLFFLPIVPLGTVSVIDEWATAGSRSVAVPFLFSASSSATTAYRAIEVPTSWTSLILGYFRSWLMVPEILAVFVLLLTVPGGIHPRDVSIANGAGAVLAVCVVVHVALAFVGRLGREETAKRGVYALFLGAPLDPTQLKLEMQAKLRDDLVRSFERSQGRPPQGVELALDGPRPSVRPGPVDWLKLASAPDNRDPEMLGAAMTLCRLEAELQPSARHRFTVAHDGLWRRLRAMRGAA